MARTDDFEEVAIGDFDRPVVPQKKKPMPAPAATGDTAAALDASAAQLEAAAQEAEKELGPLERYEKALKTLNITREEAASIVDDILTKGYWSKEFQITPRHKVTFRSRLYSDTQRFHDYIEVVQPKNPSYYNEILFQYSLAASLERYGGKVFEHPKRDATEEQADESFKRRLDYVSKLGDPALRLLYAKLAKFDEIVRTVMEEGAAENF